MISKYIVVAVQKNGFQHQIALYFHIEYCRFLFENFLIRHRNKDI